MMVREAMTLTINSSLDFSCSSCFHFGRFTSCIIPFCVGLLGPFLACIIADFTLHTHVFLTSE